MKLKTTILLVICLLTGFFSKVTAQEQYTIDGKTYILKQQTTGDLILLWTTQNGEYVYFIKKEETFYPLTNTKSGGTFKEEYKKQLQTLTADKNLAVDNLKLTLADLTKFVNNYNSLKSGVTQISPKTLELRVGIFGGISNAIFTSNPTNQNLPTIGAELELIEKVKLKRHSIVLQFKQFIESGDYKYNASQFSLNYRFKFIKKEKIAVYVNTRFATFTASSLTQDIIEDDLLTTKKSTGSDFQAVALFGLGIDYALANGFITFGYNDIAGIGVDSNGEFPLDFTLGYKFNL
jgi:hypothetical protein